MSYESRTGGPQRCRHDPAAHGIFIHGGTCLMHGRSDPFKNYARPNDFDLTIPNVGLQMPEGTRQSLLRCRTFSQALALAETIRRDHPVLHHAPIYACTDLIHDNPWTAKTQIQLVSHRLSRRQPAAIKSAA